MLASNHFDPPSNSLPIPIKPNRDKEGGYLRYRDGSQQRFQRVYRIVKRSKRSKSARLQDLTDAEQMEKIKKN